MEEEFDFPLSLKELAAARNILYGKLSFLDLMRRYSSRISDCWHTDFTHRCACPLHGKGLERTPSFYFSEKSKAFKCFGCYEGGNIFDLISVMEGRPWFYVVRDLLDSSGIEHLDLDIESRPIRSDIVYNANFKLGIELRDYLSSIRDHPLYEQEKRWADLALKRIDDRFENLDDSDQQAAASFSIMMGMELERRKNLTARKNETNK